MYCCPWEDPKRCDAPEDSNHDVELEGARKGSKMNGIVYQAWEGTTKPNISVKISFFG